MLHSEFRNVATGEIVNPDRLVYVQYEDAVVHWMVETDVLSPGSWEYTVWFDNMRTDIPAAQRLPMPPATISFPFVIKPAWAY